LREVRQLFHTLDPAPFREKDLDDDAERYLLEAYQEAGTPSEAATDAAHNLPDAVHNYYADRERELRLDLIRLLRYGAVCLGIGVAFLMTCLGLRRAGRTYAGLRQIVDEGMLILGWVAMWRPIEVLLYGRWPPFGYSGRGCATA
jgi:hypothetical protein